MCIIMAGRDDECMCSCVSSTVLLFYLRVRLRGMYEKCVCSCRADAVIFVLSVGFLLFTYLILQLSVTIIT